MDNAPTLVSEGQYLLVYNAFSFTFATMAAATLFLWLGRGNVAPPYKTALTISGLVTAIAAYHYFRIFESWDKSIEVLNGEVIATGLAFNDAYRYVDWLLTVPLLLIELILVMRLSSKETASKSWKLGGAAALMIILGYPGEVADSGTQPAGIRAGRRLLRGHVRHGRDGDGRLGRRQAWHLGAERVRGAGLDRHAPLERPALERGEGLVRPGVRRPVGAPLALQPERADRRAVLEQLGRRPVGDDEHGLALLVPVRVGGRRHPDLDGRVDREDAVDRQGRGEVGDRDVERRREVAAGERERDRQRGEGQSGHQNENW